MLFGNGNNTLNKDDSKRVEIILKNGGTFPYTDPKAGRYDIAHYSGLTWEGLQALVDGNFAELSDSQNGAPTLGDALEFMKSHPNFKAHGYIVTPDRPDYRVTVEGVTGHGCTPEDVSEFVEAFPCPDELNILPDSDGTMSCHCWYD